MEDEELKSLFSKFEPAKPAETAVPRSPALQLPSKVDKIKVFLPYVLAILILIAFFKKGPESKVRPQLRRQQITVLVPMIPIPKGSIIPNAILKVAAVDEKSLTRAQTMQVVLENDLDKLEQRLKAKKTLPPGRPLFWKDLELNTPLAQSHKPKLIFSKETSK